MKRSIFCAIVGSLLLAVVWSMSAPRQSLKAQTSPPATSFFDDFSASTFDPAWQLVEYSGPFLRSHGFGAPVNHISLTDNPGYLRYYVDPMTHYQGFLNGYQTTFSFHSCCNHDFGLELLRQFGGEHWILEAKAQYNFPTFTNGRSFQLMIYFGDGGVGTKNIIFERGRDLAQNYFRVMLLEKQGPHLTDVIRTEEVYGPNNDTLFFRLERTGSVLVPQWSTDGSTWATAFTKDMGTQLNGLEQRVVIAGGSWFNPGGSYAEWDYVKLDPTDSTPPLIIPSVIGTLGNGDWYTSDVAVSWSVVDEQSTITSQTGCEASLVSSDTLGATFSCSATSAGGAASQSVTIQRDTTAPMIDFVSRTTPNSNGWNNSVVTVNWGCSDVISGVVNSSDSQTVGGEGANQSTTGMCVDNAGNTSSDTQSGINIDLTLPVVAVTGVTEGANYTLGSIPVAGCTTSDALAGVATHATLRVTGGNSDGTGSFTTTCDGAIDNAGNSSNASINYTVQATGVLVGTCGGYAVRQNGGIYSAAGWNGSIKVGSNGNNTLNGNSGRDLMLGLGGNDLLNGQGGDDILCGGDGVDLVQGFAGNDLLDSGNGHDVINGGSGDYDVLSAGDGNDVLLDGDGVSNAAGGAGNDILTIALRYGWRDPNHQTRFAGLAAGYGNDTVGLAILNPVPFRVDITGDEYDYPASPLEGDHDGLALAGVIIPASSLIKFEYQVILSADAASALPGEAVGAEFLAEPVGEASQTLSQVIFLPLLSR